MYVVVNLVFILLGLLLVGFGLRTRLRPTTRGLMVLLGLLLAAAGGLDLYKLLTGQIVLPLG